MQKRGVSHKDDLVKRRGYTVHLFVNAKQYAETKFEYYLFSIKFGFGHLPIKCIPLEGLCQD